MANPNVVSILKKGVPFWNCWRRDFPDAGIDLSAANFCEYLLDEACLSEVNLSGADLSRAYLQNADLSGADLNGANLSDANLCGANLNGANLNGADLSDANLRSASLNGADLKMARLEGSDLREASLNRANLSRSTLDRVNFNQAQVLDTNFHKATFTGACFKDWNTNTSTNLEKAQAEYVYLNGEWNAETNLFQFSDRRPPVGCFKPDEFSTLFQGLIDTLDLVLTGKIDWQVLFASLQELRQRNNDPGLGIQAIEKKPNGAFIVRLEVSESSDKAKLHKDWDAIYKENETIKATILKMEGRLDSIDQKTVFLQNILKGMNEKPETSITNNFQGATIASVASVLRDNAQVTANQNIYGSSTDDIVRLLSSIRSQIETFPPEYKDEASDIIGDIERDLKETGSNKKRTGRRLKQLLGLSAAISTAASGAATFSGDLNEMTNNVMELREVIGVPIEQEQLPPSSN